MSIYGLVQKYSEGQSSTLPRTPMNRLRRDLAWREMFARLNAKAEAERVAEAERWRRLSTEEKWAEMAGYVRRWRRLSPPIHTR